MLARLKLPAVGLVLGTLLSGLLATGRALATPPPTTPTTSTLAFAMANDKDRQDPDNETKGPENINLKDCQNDDSFIFRFALTGVTGTTYLNAWSAKTNGTKCNTSTAQVDQCHQIAPAKMVSGPAGDIQVYIRDIVNPAVGSFVKATDESVCTSTTQEPTPLLLQFFLQEGTSQGTPPLEYTVNFDLEGPPAPSGVKTGPGQNVLVVNWKAPEISSMFVGRYYVYRASLGVFDPDAGAAGAGAGGAGGDSDSECAFAGLTPGEVPGTGVTRCGDTKGKTTQAECSGLTNGVRYAIGVTTVDTFYNAGVLSDVTCGIPEPVTGFFEAYRAAGGAGGGGYCTIGAIRSRTAALGVVLAALGFIVRRARRRAPPRGTA